MSIKVIKRNGEQVKFSSPKVKDSIRKAFKACKVKYDNIVYNNVCENIKNINNDVICIREIQDIIIKELYKCNYEQVASAFVNYKAERDRIRAFVAQKQRFIENYKKSYNNADATVDDNSNVTSKNIGILNSEIHKSDNIQISRAMVVEKLKELYPDFDAKQYIHDLEDHIIYKHDESSFAGAISPYCCSISLYPFLLNGLKDVGGLSVAPKNLDSFCGMFINLIFAVSSQFAGAVATSEFFILFDYFAKKEWGEHYYKYADTALATAQGVNRQKTILHQIHQYFQQVIYSINQPAAARGLQAAFVNFSYFDKGFFNSMFEDFFFPDGTQPSYDSIFWLQKTFMNWFNEERTKTIITFPVESYALIYKDNEFEDKESAELVAEMYSKGHSFFTYISDTADSLSSCCFEGNEIIKPFKIYDNDTMEPIGDTSIKELCEVFFKDFADFDKVNEMTINIEDKGLYINSYTLNSARPEMVKITGLLKKKYNGNIYTFKTSYLKEEKTISVTSDHLLAVVDLYDTNSETVYSLIKAEEVARTPERYLLALYSDICGWSALTIKGCEVETKRTIVYDIELEKNHLFSANDIITHNCRLKNKIQVKEFNFTNGNMGVMTGSKSVITLNINRIIQDFVNYLKRQYTDYGENWVMLNVSIKEFKDYLTNILERVYKYHTAYNDLLWDMFNANLLPVYKAGFIELDKQYLTIGINGLNEAAEFLGLECNYNNDYKNFCQMIFSIIKDENIKHKEEHLNFNTECVPAESLGIKNYNWDKEDGYVVPKERNLYGSYIYVASDDTIDISERILLHGRDYIGDYLDGGSAAHLNLEEHLTKEQYAKVLKFAAENGCQYLTFNIINTQCEDCGHIEKHRFDVCPKCGSTNVSMWTRIIGYLTKIKNWSEGRRIEHETRYYEKR